MLRSLSRLAPTPGSAIILIVFSLLSVASVRADEVPPPSLDSAIRAIEHFEEKIERIQFDSHLTSGRYADTNELAHVQVSGEGEQNFSLVYERNTGRIKLRTWGYGKWLNGPAPYNGYNCSLSFDGNQQKELTIQRAGRTAPKEEAVDGHGIVTANRNYDQKGREAHFIVDWLGSSGLHYFPPYFFGKRFSALLMQAKESKQISLKQAAANTWVFGLPDFDPPGTGCEVLLTYDAVRGVVTGADWVFNNKVCRKHVVYLTKLPNDYWVPERIDVLNLTDKLITRWQFSKAAINQPVEDADFSLTFPLGTQVLDHIEKKQYIVGKGVVNDEAAILSYAQLHGLRLTEDAPRENSDGFTTKRLLISAAVAGPGLALLLYLLFVKGKTARRTLGKGAPLVLFGLLFACSSAEAQEINEKGEWIKRDENGKISYLSHCGWNISMLALECFDIRSHLPHMAEAVPPTETGVNFGDVQTWLEANGLKCVPRKNVDLIAIEKHLSAKMMAIYVIKTSAKGYNHFVAVLNHPRLGKLFLNPRQPPIALEDIADESSFQPLDGLVLFVSRDPGRKKQADEVNVTPSSIDLGRFAMNGRDAGNVVYHSISFQNDSALPAHITKHTSVCGCLGSLWKGGVLKAGEKKDVQFWVLKGGWGQVGAREKTITIGFADGSEKSILWKGEAYLDPDGNALDSRFARLTVTPSPLFFTLEEGVRQPVNPKAEVRIWSVGAEAGKGAQASLASNCKWLSYSFKDGSPESGIVLVSVIQEALPEGGRTLEGKIRVRAGENLGEVKVILTRRAFFECVPDVLACKGTSSTEMTVKLVRQAHAKHSFAHVEVTEKPKGCSIEVQNVASAAASLRVRTENMDEGIHFLTIKVTDEFGKSSTRRVLVRASK